MTSRQESRVNNLLHSLFGSKAHSNKTQSEESQSTPSAPRQQSFKWTALRASTQDVRASVSRPNILQDNPQVSKQKRRERYLQHHKSTRRPKFNPYSQYKVTNAFASRICFPGNRILG